MSIQVGAPDYSGLPRIDMAATGRNIARLRRASGLSVRELQSALSLSSPQAVYKWQRGETLPSLDNLLALSALLDTAMEEILVCERSEKDTPRKERK